MDEFPETKIDERKILIPDTDDFPIQWNRKRTNAFEALEIVCQQMQISVDSIDLNIEEATIKEFDTGGSVIFLEPDNDAPQQYQGTNAAGKYIITINEDLLKKPNTLIACLAHEVAQVRLIEENRIDQSDGMLADLTTVFFGLGLFNANASFEFGQEFDRWGYNRLGYLKLDEWAYALAVFAFLRKEVNPPWEKHLSKTLTADFEKSMKYIVENETEVFRFKEENI